MQRSLRALRYVGFAAVCAVATGAGIIVAHEHAQASKAQTLVTHDELMKTLDSRVVSHIQANDRKIDAINTKFDKRLRELETNDARP